MVLVCTRCHVWQMVLVRRTRQWRPWIECHITLRESAFCVAVALHLFSRVVMFPCVDTCSECVRQLDVTALRSWSVALVYKEMRNPGAAFAICVVVALLCFLCIAMVRSACVHRLHVHR